MRPRVRGKAQLEVSCITLKLTRAWRLFFRPWTPSMKVGMSETRGNAFIGWFGATISAMRCAAKRMRIPALGSFSENGCPAAPHCASARAWLTRGRPLVTWTEVTERSPDASTDKEVACVSIDSSRDHLHIDEMLSARRARCVGVLLRVVRPSRARSALLRPSTHHLGCEVRL